MWFLDQLSSHGSLTIVVVLCVQPVAPAVYYCGLGEYMVSNPDTGEISCQPCPDGMFMDQEEHTNVECITCYRADYYLSEVEEEPCTKTKDTVIHCTKGHYRELHGPDFMPTCVRCRPCGKYGKTKDLPTVVKPCGLYHDTVCGQAVYLNANPPVFTPGITDELGLECNIKSLLPAVNEVFVIQIDREEGGNVVPLATITRSGIQLDNGLGGRLTATGNLDVNGPGPYLNVTIEWPGNQDSGNYVCVVSITDKSSALVKLQYSTNVTHQDITNSQITEQFAKVNEKLELLQLENKALKNQVTILEQNKNNLTAIINMLASQNCTNTTPNTDHENRLAQLENEVKEHQRESNQSEALIQKTLDTLTNRISNQTNTCDDVKNDLTVLQNNQSNILSEIVRIDNVYTSLASSVVLATSNGDSLNQRVDALEIASVEHYKEIGQLQGLVKGLAPEPIMFSASHPIISVTDPNNGPQTGAIIFKNIITNANGSYDKTSGEFTAPKTGKYLFSLSLAINTGQSSALQAAIKVQGQLIAYTGTSTTGLLNQGAVTAITHMNAGEKSLIKVAQLINPPVTLKADSCLFSGVFLG